MSWEQRMAEAAHDRAEQERAIDEAPDPRQERWAAFVDALGGYFPSVWDGRFTHAHPAHANWIRDAADPAWSGGVFSIVLDDGEPWPADAPCSVCAAFVAADWSLTDELMAARPDDFRRWNGDQTQHGESE